MLSEIKELIKDAMGLKTTISGDVPEQNLMLAIGVLFLDMAGADNDFAPEEIQTCFRSLEKLFNISDSKALEILEEAEKVRNDKEQINELIQGLNTHFSEDQRCIILALVWKVVVADQQIEKHELRLANQIRVRLQLSEDQNEAARQLAFSGGV